MFASDNDSLLQLCRVLLPDEPSLADDVRLAITDPHVYLDQFEPRHRGISAAVPDLPWIALVDGLAERDRLVEHRYHDIDAIGYSLQNRLEQSQTIDYMDWPPEAEQLALATEAILHRFGQFYLRHGWVLVHFDINSDSWVLSLIETEKLSLARALALRAGYGTIVPITELLPDPT